MKVWSVKYTFDVWAKNINLGKTQLVRMLRHIQTIEIIVSLSVFFGI